MPPKNTQALEDALLSITEGLAAMQSPFSQPKPPQLYMPEFDGSNVSDWLFQAEQYFQLNNIDGGDQRLHYAAFYFRGEALTWFQWMHRNNQLSSWPEFTRAVELRFSPSNPQASLFKLQQTSTVAAYQAEFERLCNRVHDLSPPALLSCFISGLRPDIQRQVTVLQPTTISQAMALAKLVESKVTASSQIITAHPPPPDPRPPHSALLQTLKSLLVKSTRRLCSVIRWKEGEAYYLLFHE